MAVTGEPYTVALRAVASGSPGCWRSDWFSSAWMRLLPVQATPLEIAITTATVHDAAATLEKVLADNPARCDLPDGAATALAWSTVDDDAYTASRRDVARQAFELALRDGGFSMPTTVAELADILAQLGVFESTQTSNGPTIWRAPEDLPAPATVLQLPEDWLAHEDRVHWKTVTSLPADTLRRKLLQAGKPEQLETTIDGLAEINAATSAQVRAALDGQGLAQDVLMTAVHGVRAAPVRGVARKLQLLAGQGGQRGLLGRGGTFHQTRSGGAVAVGSNDWLQGRCRSADDFVGNRGSARRGLRFRAGGRRDSGRAQDAGHP